MSEEIATFFNARIGTAKYLFLVTNNSAFDIQLRKALHRSVPKFGAVIAERGRISTIHDSSEQGAYAELLRKPWPEKVASRLTAQNSPFLVVIKKDFSEFDPGSDEWFIIWLVGLGQPRNAIPMLFDRLARAINAGDDLFDFLKSKIVNPGGLFRTGAVWSGDSVDAVPIPRRRGRPAIVSEESLRYLDKVLRESPCTGPHRNRDYAIIMRDWLKRQGAQYSLKSVRGALRRAKWFEYAERISQIGERE